MTSKAEFDRVWPLLQPSVDTYGKFYTKEYLWKEIEQRKAFLAAGANSAVIFTMPVHSTGVKCLNYWFAGGDLEEIKTFQPGLEAWARAEGCSCAIMFGRKGWAGVLEGDWVESGVRYRKELL